MHGGERVEEEFVGVGAVDHVDGGAAVVVAVEEPDVGAPVTVVLPDLDVPGSVVGAVHGGDRLEQEPIGVGAVHDVHRGAAVVVAVEEPEVGAPVAVVVAVVPPGRRVGDVAHMEVARCSRRSGAVVVRRGEVVLLDHDRPVTAHLRDVGDMPVTSGATLVGIPLGHGADGGGRVDAVSPGAGGVVPLPGVAPVHPHGVAVLGEAEGHEARALTGERAPGVRLVDGAASVGVVVAAHRGIGDIWATSHGKGGAQHEERNQRPCPGAERERRGTKPRVHSSGVVHTAIEGPPAARSTRGERAAGGRRRRVAPSTGLRVGR